MNVEDILSFTFGNVQIINDSTGYVYYKGYSRDVINYSQNWLDYRVAYISNSLVQKISKKGENVDSYINIYVKVT